MAARLAHAGRGQRRRARAAPAREHRQLSAAATHWLFCYGTLREGRVQHRVFGRPVGGLRDALEGSALGELTIDGAKYPTLRRGSAGSGRVGGLVLRVNDDELTRADAYETAAYARVEVNLVSGRRAFVYVASDAG